MNSLKYKTYGFNVLSTALVILFSMNSFGETHTVKQNKIKKHDRSVISFDQGWSNDEALDFYNTSQGSQLMPYSWFLALEQADSETLFRDNANVKKLGYITQAPLAGRNPDGLPIGFVKDDVPEAFLVNAMAAERLGIQNNEQANYNEWLGLTCAACHTAQISYGNHSLRINGGPALSDMPAFLMGLQKSLKATIDNDDKLTRFSKQVLAQGGFNDIEKKELKKQLISFNIWLDGYLSVNYGGLTTPYGYGRLDAFGAILNRVTTSLLGIPSNGIPANAPVSYPFLWNTSQLDWVQWNGSANNHIGRNVGEVTGVFAHTILKTDNEKDRFYSSAKIVNLDQLEQLMARLDSPKWGSPLPKINQKEAEAGAVLYASNCMSCHGIRDSKGNFPMTKINAVGKSFIKINMIKLEEIGTDPLMAVNFVSPAFNVDPGQMRPYLDPKKMKEYIHKHPDSNSKVPRAFVLTAAVEQIIKKQADGFKPPLTQEQMLELAGYHLGGDAPNLLAYKARPLNGIWATAPYLHNGSVASLYQLLLPAAEREKSFYVGSNILDAKNVGFESTKSGNYFLFNTIDEQGKPIAGNSNYGHSGNRYTQTLDKNGQWQNFTNEERYQLIEYLKTL